ncbi:hypothetical protein HYDPIDRAFT_27428 [Hydnomerulius pinastri MD-312]|nr:hypothetical protein HYDPIDRAFT_27428 [Hydnomerulius pinastri MD-312]
MSTARLKRKLGDLGVDTSSRKANENFCLIGTPLPPLEKSKDTGEFVPLWKQEVRDEKGRRRLHGAFTGGFSAGYFNSVGSKEGWAPSTFVSSRSDRAKARAAKPEDFMDEEDLAELRADQKLVDEHDEMDIIGGTQAERDRRGGADDSEKDPITLALEKATLPAPKDSVGARILKKMGWRLGQGIGPRVTWRQHEIQYGRDPDATSAEVDEEAKKHTYAPRDTTLIIVERKEDFHGLGYNRGLGLQASLGVGQEGSKANQGPQLAGGFGLGALNDADEDDLDVYDHSTSHGRSRHAFDASDMHDDEHVVIGNRRHGHEASRTTAQARSSQKSQANSGGTFRDGRPPLAGFVLSDKPVAEDMWFPIPDVPKGWKPNPKRVWEQQRAAEGDKENKAAPKTFPVPSQTQTHAQWKSGISADERGAALGETPLPSAPRSVFEYMSKKDQERIKNIASGRFTAPTANETAEQPSSSSAPQQSYIPHTEPHIAQAALRGFQPFTTDPTKQARYMAYLRANAEHGSGATIPPRMPTQTAETYAREMSEFAKAAALFRPVSGAMAGRFTSAAVLDLGPKIIEGLHTPSAEQALHDKDSETDNDNQKDKEGKDEDPKVHAARLGMYGTMTREVKHWQPARLLCKRFGVKDPDPEVPVETPEVSTSASASQGTGLGAELDASMGAIRDGTSSFFEGRTASSGKRDLTNIGLGEDDRQGDDILTYERPAMDIFKAIFASDDEGSDDEGDNKAQDDEATAIQTPPEPSDPPTSVPMSASNPTKSGVVTEVDLSTFKPTFIPRDSQPKSAKAKASSAKEKKSKKPKGGVLVSFDLDEDGGEPLSLSAPPREKRDRDSSRPKKKRKKQDAEGDKGDEWVEKPPPDIVKGLLVDVPPDESMKVDVAEGGSGPPRGRKRAVDFM